MNTIPIPDIAELLRAHLNTDNDAKRLICEHVLPLVGIEADTVTELEELTKTPANYDAFVDDMRTDLDDLISDFSGTSRDEILHELKRIRGTFV
jgi:type IV secretory pathway TrbF-like protein